MKRNHRWIAVILVVILVVAMVLPFLLDAVYAADKATETVTKSSSASSDEESVQSSSGSDAGSDTSGSAGGGCRDGVYIENIDVSGMTEEEVQDVIDGRIESLSSEPITLYAGDKSVTVTAGDLGLYCTDDGLAGEASKIGRSGNVVRRFLADQYVKENGRIVLSMDLGVKKESVKSVISRFADQLNSDPQSVTIQIESDGTLTPVDKVDGKTVKIDDSITAVENYMNNDWHGGAGGVRLVTETVPAEGDLADLDGITDQLGTYTTEFDSTNTGRVTNIRRAAELINGTIVQPGEEFDFSEVVGETTAENGFALAGSYENGSVVDTYGGGICQVSTTLYNAVLRAELDVTERSPHSITVDYVEPSLDAAIADGQKDFCFENSSEHAIYIYASVGEDSITFSILGKETREAGRELEFSSKTISTTPYTTQIKLDSSRNYGVIESTGGHDGVEAEAWKTIYVNGTKQGEEQVNSSEYQMVPLTYLVGVKGASESQLAALQTAAENNDLATIRSLVW